MAAAIAAVLWAAPSCGTADPETPSDFNAKISVTKTEVTSDKGNLFVQVSAPTSSSWTLSLSVSGRDGWASLSATSGTGPKSVILSYDENTDETPRSVTVTLSGPATSSLTIVQAGKTKAPVEQKPALNGFVTPSTKAGWLELPATSSSDQMDLLVHTVKEGGTTRRDWSCYWNYDDLVAMWVAYPLNKGLIGSGSRSDAWGLDPLLPADKQPVIARAFGSGNNGHYDRGHQIPSADRLSYSQNVTTFYGTNMTPQDNDFNAGIWASLESKVRGWGSSSDTLYVVTGCVLKDTKYYALDNVGKRVTVPTAYYKAVLRYQKNSTMGVSGYMGCALYLEHDGKLGGSLKPFAMSIDALEEKLGIDLFVNLPSVVGETAAGKIEAEDPGTISWWW